MIPIVSQKCLSKLRMNFVAFAARCWGNFSASIWNLPESNIAESIAHGYWLHNSVVIKLLTYLLCTYFNNDQSSSVKGDNALLIQHIRHSTALLVEIFYRIRQAAALVAKLVLKGAFGTPILRKGGGRRCRQWYHSQELWWFPIGSPLWPLRYLYLFGRNLPSNVSDAQINRVTLEQNLGRKGLTDVSQILTEAGRDIGLSYA